MIRRWGIIFCVTLSLTTIFHAGAPRAAAQYPVNGHVTLSSRYMFQGIDYSDGHPVLQPEVSLGYQAVSFTAWTNVDLNARHLNELDWIVSYSREYGALSVGAGYAIYQYPNRDWDPSQEVYLDLAYAALLDLSVNAHYDFDAGDGMYFTVELGGSLDGPLGALHLGSKVFYQRRYYGSSGIPSWEFMVSHRSVIHGYSVTPSVSYFATWNNGDFQGQSAVPSRWLFSLTVGGHD